jgi:hypothetical protein
MKRLPTFLRAGFFGMLTLFAAGSAQAISVVEFIDAVIDTGPGAGAMGTLTVEFDSDDVNETSTDSLLYGVDGEFFSLELDILGMVFTEMDDIDFGFGGFPRVFFFDRAITAVDFIVETSIDGADGLLIGSTVVDGQYLIDSFVPVPGTALLALLGLGLLAHRRRI